MPDVGILNLQIHADSSEAEGKLRQVADALSRVRAAVTGLKLGGIAGQIQKIAATVNNDVSGSTIQKLGEFGDALSKLKGLGNVSINIRSTSGVKGVVESVQAGNEALWQIGSTAEAMAQEVEDGFEKVVPKTTEAADAFKELREAMAGGGKPDFSQFDPSNLPMGMLGAQVRDFDQAVEAAQMSRQMMSDLSTATAEGAKSLTEGLETAVKSGVEPLVEKTNEAVSAGNGYTAACREAQDATEKTTEALEEQIRARKEAMKAEDQRRLERSYPQYSELFMSGEDNWAHDVPNIFGLTENALRQGETYADALKITMDEVNRYVDEFIEKTNTPTGPLFRDAIDEANGWNRPFKSAEESAHAMEVLLREQEIMQEAAAKTQKYAQEHSIAATIVEKLNGLVLGLYGAFKKQSEALEETSNGAKTLSEKFNALVFGTTDMSDKMKRIFPTLTQLSKRFRSLIMYRSLRAVLKSITSGFREGVENVYQYSKAIGSSFAPSMDSAASALLQMKNSLGAAAAPLIQSLIPLLQKAVNWFIEIVNYANQFLALMRGQVTWTKAVPATAKAFDDQKKAAKGAAAAVKDLLADWDELNIIQSETGGGGGGGGTTAAEDYLKMFEEVGTFENRIQDVVKFIKDNFDTIKAAALGIGAAILGWKISNAFGNTLAFLKSLTLTAGLTLLITGVTMSTAAGYDAGKNGINSGNLLKMVGGIFESAIGGGLVGVAYGGITGGVIGLTVGAAIGLMAAGAAFREGQYDALYGDIKLSAEQVQGAVDSLFAFDVNAKFKEAKIDHDSFETAKANLETAMRKANTDYATFKLRLTTDSALELAASVGDTVRQANAMLKQFQQKISVGFGLDLDGSGKAVQQSSTRNIMGLETYITGLGNDIGKLLQDGIIDGVQEAPILEELMRKLNNVAAAVAQGRAGAEFAVGLEKSTSGWDWSSVDRDSLKQYANLYNEQVGKVREAGYLNATDMKATLASIYAGMVQANLDTPGTFTQAEIDKALSDWQNYDVEKAVGDFVDAATAEGKSIFIKNMSTAFGSAVEKLSARGGHLQMTGLSELERGADMKEWFQNVLAQNLGWSGAYGDQGAESFRNVLDTMGVTGWGMLTDQMKLDFIRQMMNTFGNYNSDMYAELRDKLQIPVDEILTLRIGSKEKWDSLDSDLKNGFISALMDAYGPDAVMEAMEKAGFGWGGIDIPNLTEAEIVPRLSTDEELQSIWNEKNPNAHIEVPMELVPGNYTQQELQNLWEDMHSLTPYGESGGNSQEEMMRILAARHGGAFVDPTQVPAPYVGGPGGKAEVDVNEEQMAAGVQKGTSNANIPVVDALRAMSRSLEDLRRRPIVVNLGTSTRFARWGQQNVTALEDVTG